MIIKKFIGTKKFYKEVILIAIPIVLQQFITSFVNLIDNIMVGSIGDMALMSVTVSNRFYMLFNATLFGLCGATSIFIAQYYGAKNNKKCQKVFNLTIMLALISALLFTSVLVFIPKFSLHIFTRTPEIVELGLDYIKYIKYTYIPYAITFACMMSLRAVGINKTQLLTGVMAIVINTVLNYCLIFGNFGFPELGVVGAAIATLIARVIEMVVWIWILLRNKHFFKLDLVGILHLDFSFLREVIRKAIPLLTNETLYSLGIALVFKAYMQVSEALIPAIAVVDTVSNIAFIIFGGVSSAISIMIGNRLGANKLEEAKDNSLKLIVFAVMISSMIGLLLFVIAPYIPNIYQLSFDVNQSIVVLLRIKSVVFPVFTVNVCVFLILTAGGDTKSILIMDALFLWVISVTFATLLANYSTLPLVMVYMIVEGLDFIKVILAIYYFKKGTWLRNITVT